MRSIFLELMALWILGEQVCLNHLPSVGVVTFLGRSSGDRFIGLEWNIPEYGFFEDDKSGVKKRHCKEL